MLRGSNLYLSTKDEIDSCLVKVADDGIAKRARPAEAAR